MKSLYIFPLAAALLAGCATNQIDPSIPSNATIQADAGGNNFVSKVSFSFPTTENTGKNLGKCIALHIDNEDAELKDSSRSFFGAYTGNYYRIKSESNSSGGEVLRHLDETTAIAEGRSPADYTFMGGNIKAVIDYKLMIDASGPETSVVFSNLTRAMLDTGAASNEGFMPIGAWSAANPVSSVNALDTVHRDIRDCLSQ